MLFLTVLLYFAFLILSASLPPVFYFWRILFFVGILSIGIVKVVGKSKSLLLLPILLIAASFVVNLFFASKVWFYSFSILSAATLVLILFLRQEIKNKENPEDRRKHPRLRNSLAFNKSIAIAVMAVCFIGFFAIQENTEISFWIVLAGFFAISVSAFWEVIRFNVKNSREAALISSVGGFVIMEFAWALSFWPLGFFSNAVILLSLSYVFLDIVDIALVRKVPASRIAADAGLALLAILIVAGTSKWLPL